MFMLNLQKKKNPNGRCAVCSFTYTVCNKKVILKNYNFICLHFHPNKKNISTSIS